MDDIDSQTQLIAGDILTAIGSILFFFICFVQCIVYRSEEGMSFYTFRTQVALCLSILALALLITGAVLIATYTPSITNSTVIIVG